MTSRMKRRNDKRRRHLVPAPPGVSVEDWGTVTRAPRFRFGVRGFRGIIMMGRKWGAYIGLNSLPTIKRW